MKSQSTSERPQHQQQQQAPPQQRHKSFSSEYGIQKIPANSHIPKNSSPVKIYDTSSYHLAEIINGNNDV